MGWHGEREKNKGLELWRKDSRRCQEKENDSRNEKGGQKKEYERDLRPKIWRVECQELNKREEVKSFLLKIERIWKG